MIESLQDYMDAIQARARSVAKREAEKGDEAKAAYDTAIQTSNDYIAALDMKEPTHG